MANPLYRASLDEDLRPLSALLWQQRIAHRIVEEGGEQVLLLADAGEQSRAAALLERWQSGDVKVTLRPAPSQPKPPSPLPGVIRAAPVTLTLIALSVVGFLLIYLAAPVSWVAQLTYDSFTLQGGRP
ncbi:MAG: rhomboid family intramembrane serine protease, partial [Congregibacter sp.]|nr:rhomboid family intramembrane serine protease [Congregibacter sp.]